MGTLNLGNGARFVGGTGGKLSDCPAGTVLQTVGQLNTGGGTSTSTSGSWVQTYLEEVITPIAASSKILILMTGMGGYLGGSSGGYGNATVGWQENSGSFTYLGDGTNGLAYIYNNPGQAGWWTANVSLLHTPSYTLGSSLKYALFIRATSNVNPIAIGNGNSHSPAVLMEIAS